MKRGLTFDDVLLMPGYSEVLPSEVSLKTELVKGINLNIPITSTAMDTVTESKLAIAIAREGGIGIITGLFAMYSAVGQIVNHELGKNVLPL